MSAYSDALKHQPSSLLQTMLTNRKADASRFNGIKTKSDLAERMAQEFGRSHSLQDAIAHCNAHQLQYLQACVTLQRGGRVAWRRVVEHLGGVEIETPLAKAAKGLAERGLAVRHENEVFLQPGLESMLPTSLSSQYSLEKCLQNYDMQAVMKIAENLGVKPFKANKANSIAAINEFLLASDLRERIARILSAEDRDLLEYIRDNGGSASANDVLDSATTTRSYYYRYEWHSKWKTGSEETSIDRLLAHGLIYPTWQGYSYNTQIVIPGDLLKAMSDKSDNSFWLEIADSPAPLVEPPVSVSPPPNLVRDVAAMLGYLQSQECVRTGTGQIHRTSLKNSVRYLQYPDETYASFLYCLCRDADFLYVSGEKQIYGVNDKGRSWLHWDKKTQHRVLFEAWRDGLMWGEMYAEPVRKANAPRSPDFIGVLRQKALSLFAESDSDKFLHSGTILALFMFRCPLILSDGRSNEEMLGSQVLYLRCFAEECLYWLGLIELGWKEALPPAVGSPALRLDRLSAVGNESPPIGYRLTALGRWLLKKETFNDEEPPREEQFILQANGEAFVPPYLSPDKFFRLLNFAEFPLKGKQATHPVITKESLRRAIDRGETAQTTLAFLNAASRTGAPQNIEYLINEVGGKHGHIHIGRATLYIQTESPILLQELQARKEFKGLFHRTLSDNIALLNSEDLDKTLKDLRKAGYLPVSDEDSAPQSDAGKASVLKPPPPVREDAVAQKQATRRQLLERAIDWRRIGAEQAGGAPPVAGAAAPKHAPSQMPAGAQAGQQVVRFLVMQSINRNMPLEIAMASATPGEPATFLIQPKETDGDIITYQDLQKKTYHLIHFGMILWARLVK